MENFYKPLSERTPDTQYRDRLAYVLEHGVLIKDTPQGIGALTCFGTLAPMVFDLSNGIPLITERKISFWDQPLAEIIAFINGARTIPEIQAYGCRFWNDYLGEGSSIGLAPDDMGPGSYGPSFHDFEKPNGDTLNQFAQLIEQIRQYAFARTHLVTPWKPYYTARGKNRKVIVAPCHGWLHFRVIEGKLHMRMDQRSADLPIGVPSNMFQYGALLLMVCAVTGYEPGNYIHSFADAHIYENQVPAVKELLERETKPFPLLYLDSTVHDLFAFRNEHFRLAERDEGPGLKIPYSP